VERREHSPRREGEATFRAAAKAWRTSDAIVGASGFGVLPDERDWERRCLRNPPYKHLHRLGRAQEINLSQRRGVPTRTAPRSAMNRDPTISVIACGSQERNSRASSRRENKNSRADWSLL
jgi:hypothetical protein